MNGKRWTDENTRTLVGMSKWNRQCSEILRQNEGKHHDHEVALLIEAHTGMRFSPKTVQRRRLAAGFSPCTRNDHTRPLIAWWRFMTLEEFKQKYP